MRSSKISYASLVVIFLFFFFLPSANAATVTLSDPSSSSLSSPDGEFQVKVKLDINSSDETKYYLRGVFCKEGTSNYCGYTWNGSSWFSGPYSKDEGWKNFLPVSISSSSAETVLKAKIDSQDSGCKSSGIYKFKVQRFTESGSGTFDSQNEQSIEIAVPTPIPTLTPTSSPTRVPTAVPTSKQYPSATTVKVANTSAPTAVFTSRIGTVTTIDDDTYSTTQSAVIIDDYDSSKSSVLAESTSSAKGEDGVKNQSERQTHVAPYLFLSAGILFVSSAVVLFVKRVKKAEPITD